MAAGTTVGSLHSITQYISSCFMEVKFTTTTTTHPQTYCVTYCYICVGRHKKYRHLFQTPLELYRSIWYPILEGNNETSHFIIGTLYWKQDQVETLAFLSNKQRLFSLPSVETNNQDPVYKGNDQNVDSQWLKVVFTHYCCANKLGISSRYYSFSSW